MGSNKTKQDAYIHMKRQTETPDTLSDHSYSKKNKKAPKPQSRLDAEKGVFPFDEINGFKLKEVEWTIPNQKDRKRKRKAFGNVRKEFLMYIGQHLEPQLREMGLTDAQIKQVKGGNAPNGYNVHHKLPIFGGGKNEFSNLILMPIKPHDELHHKVMDPQTSRMQDGDSKKVLVPWSDDMVYISPEKKKTWTKEKAAAMVQNPPPYIPPEPKTQTPQAIPSVVQQKLAMRSQR